MGVLGEMEVRLGGRSLPLGHARQRSVLAVLVVEAVEAERVVSVDALIDRVWGGRPPNKARSALRVYLSHLRRALATAGIAITRRYSGYAVDIEPDAVDLHRFRRLHASARGEGDQARALVLVEEALALWRGEPVPELPDTPWAQALRERLQQERVAAEVEQADRALACGRHHELLPELTARAETDPLDEHVAGQLMLALYRAGRQADALRHYQLSRQRLVEELGTEPGPALRELHQRILTADDALTGTSAPVPMAPTPVPRQLPPAPAHFTGRAAELAELTAVLDREGRHSAAAVSTVVGPGGIGKTWLVLHWAHRHADLFPDGQLFADLQGFSPVGEPVDPSTALSGFLTALGVPPHGMPADLSERTALFRSLVADKRVLVVLDNARDDAPIAPLLPGGGACAVVVTSRNRLTGLLTRHGASSLRVDVLPDDEARQVLVDRLGAARTDAEPDAVAALTARCGRFPLALGIVASRATTHPRFPLAVLADELRDASTRLIALDDGPAAGLPAVLSWSHDALPAAQARLFALLGLAPGPDIGLAAAVALTGLPEPEVRAGLRGLEDAHLIGQHAPRRWRAHDLIRLYAAERAQDDLTAGERAAARRRLLDHYLHTALAADRVIEPHRPPIQLTEAVPGSLPCPSAHLAAAMEWFTAEHANLLAAQHLAAGLDLHEYVWQLAWTLDNFHHRNGHMPAALAAWRAGLAAADRSGDLGIRVLARRQLGHVATDAQRYDEAMDHLDQALKLATHAADQGSVARIHHILARVHDARGQHDRALAHATRALALYQVQNEPVWEAGALNEVGWQRARLGDHELARNHCEAALDLARRHAHRDFEAASLDSLGYIARQTGDLARALEHYREALVLYQALGHTYSEAETLEHLGLTLQALGRDDDARSLWLRSVELFRGHHRDRDAQRVDGHLAELPVGDGTD